jgi:hypothetical protein
MRADGSGSKQLTTDLYSDLDSEWQREGSSSASHESVRRPGPTHVNTGRFATVSFAGIRSHRL